MGIILSPKFPFEIGGELTKALQYYQSGQLRKAAEIYKRILFINPNHSDSLHLLGLIALQDSRSDIAVNFIEKAIQNNSENPVYYNSLGTVFQSQGRLNEAISCYQKALDIKPDLAETYNSMGISFQNQGRLDEAISCYQKALTLKPDYAKAYNSMATAFQSQGRLDEAISCYQKALKIEPDYANAYNNMGIAFQSQGRLNEAISCYQKALDSKPDLAEAYYGMATAFQNQGRLNEAISYYQKALDIKPGYAEAYNNMGIVFKEQGRLDEAISCYQKALDIRPGYAEAYNNMGIAFQKQGRLNDAISCYQKAMKIKPDYANANNNMGIAFQKQGRLDEAISSYQKTLDIKPDLPEAYNSMGTAFQDQGRLNDAISCYQKALDIRPGYAEVYNNMGIAFQKQGRLKEAISSYQKALDIKPDFPEAYSQLFHQLQQTCAWQNREDMTEKLDIFTRKALDNGTKVAETPFISLSRNADLSLNFAIAKSWSCDIIRTMSSLKNLFSFDDGRSCKTKIAVGYLSNDFHNHPVAHLMLPLFGLHNRNEFEIFCYSYGEDDGSHYRRRIRQDCDKFVDLRSLDHTDAAKRIYEDRIDILIDLKGFLGDNRLEICALRPAPIQVRYLGLAGTTGADFFDYIITDRIVTPEDHAQYYSENFVYLPHSYQVNDHNQEISNKDWKKANFGIPEDSFAFCSFNQGYKIDPIMFDCWMNILLQVPKGVLWLQRINEAAEKNLREEAESRGVEPARLIFAERLLKNEHLSRLRLADLALDTRIVNGAATTSDALWAGVPVITLQGGNFASRMSSSILRAIGLSELAVGSLEEYEALAVQLACSPGEMQTIRQRLEKNRLTEPLFDTSRFVRNLEKAYKEMWGIFINGQGPRQIEVIESQT